ncbi:MAG: VCBS repeat-containing protein [Cyclobacteriaceae bacterium]|nr:VCBS repeat-containing protein [Cyclobacteriaceae bacterium]
MNRHPLLTCLLPVFIALLAMMSCGHSPKRFVLIPPERSGLEFQNTLVASDSFNVFDFEYMYNGGGVAIGDIDNDGLEDVYFTGNTASSRLYRNKGNLQFEDITDQAGVGTWQWATGVTMADVNADGWLDIYVCVSGHRDSTIRKNLLFINNTNGTFTERAQEFGLASTRFSTQAAFFDFDRDGDLDMYLMNHSNKDRDATVLTPPLTDGSAYSTDQLFENRHGKFFDVSHARGIRLEGYGLGLALGDFNDDGWTDIYVANDYVFNDVLYINQQGAFFKDEAAIRLRHTSHFSMGADAADLNNDGWADVLVADMMPPDNERQKKLSGPVSYNHYEMARQLGYQPSFMRNMLQINAGKGHFAEIGIATEMYQTDWSWSVLLADFDNNTHRDVFITNGYFKNITDRDFAIYTFQHRKGMVEKGNERENIADMLRNLPGAHLQNRFFSNTGDLQFADETTSWLEDKPSYSNGAAYADLDHDGDLDLVVNNLDEPAFLLENQSPRAAGHFLHVKLEGPAENRFGEGASVALFEKDVLRQKVTKHSTRGYQSSVSQILHLGLGEAEHVDVLVTWPDGRTQRIDKVAANQQITLTYTQASVPQIPSAPAEGVLLTDVTDSLGFQHTPTQSDHDDFNYEPLLLGKQSVAGPVAAVADVDGNGLEDVYIGGTKGKRPLLWLQQANRQWITYKFPANEAVYEDAAAIFLDVNNDHHPDLYVVSGGNSFMAQMPYYQDRLYLNDGQGNFQRAHLPNEVYSGSCVAAADYDQDGDTDIFVGAGGYPQRYPLPDKSFLLQNNQGAFQPIEIVAGRGQALHLGIVRSACWVDVDGDTWVDLVLAGDFMPVSVYQNQRGKGFRDVTKNTGLSAAKGFWQKVMPMDADGDGDMDLALGNYGINTVFKGTREEPFSCRAIDVDGTGTLDPV